MTPIAKFTLRGTADEARRFLKTLDEKARPWNVYEVFEIADDAVWVAVDYEQFADTDGPDDAPDLNKILAVRCYANGEAAKFRAERGSPF